MHRAQHGHSGQQEEGEFGAGGVDEDVEPGTEQKAQPRGKP
jgi:hypothetical protein